MGLDREALTKRATEIADGLMLSTGGIIPEDEIGAMALFKAVSDSIGGVHMLETGNYPEEAKLIKELTDSESFKRAKARIFKERE